MEEELSICSGSRSSGQYGKTEGAATIPLLNSESSYPKYYQENRVFENEPLKMPRAARIRFTEFQKHEMMKVFNDSPYLAPGMADALSKKLKVNRGSIVLWFKNMRVKCRKNMVGTTKQWMYARYYSFSQVPYVPGMAGLGPRMSPKAGLCPQVSHEAGPGPHTSPKAYGYFGENGLIQTPYVFGRSQTNGYQDENTQMVSRCPCFACAKMAHSLDGRNEPS